jgi:phosphatidylglycerol:prolipoprotein diacylglycerol transferase
MYPYLNLGFAHPGTFGILLWFAAVCGTIVLYRNFLRFGIDADALNVVTLVVIAGIIGAKSWHELQNIPELKASWHQIMLPGWHQPKELLFGFLHWFQAGFAWFGGLLAGIATLLWQGRVARFAGPSEGVKGPRIGGLRMLDLAAPAAAIGYGVGRIGCLTSGDGDYGLNTTLPWGVHMARNALVPPTPPDALVQPTPIYELLYAIVIFAIVWKLAEKHKPVGWITGLYLVLSGVGRFLVEFVRINPRIYWGMSNAQVAALGSIVGGLLLLSWSIAKNRPWSPASSPVGARSRKIPVVAGSAG